MQKFVGIEQEECQFWRNLVINSIDVSFELHFNNNSFLNDDFWMAVQWIITVCLQLLVNFIISKYSILYPLLFIAYN